MAIARCFSSNMKQPKLQDEEKKCMRINQGKFPQDLTATCNKLMGSKIRRTNSQSGMLDATMGQLSTVKIKYASRFHFVGHRLIFCQGIDILLFVLSRNYIFFFCLIVSLKIVFSLTIFRCAYFIYGNFFSSK